MRLTIINASVVVLAHYHNPSLLHPAFLTKQGIVPEDWELAELPVCTPPISIVKYKNGLVFTVESEKFQLMDNDPPADGGSSLAPSVATRYIQTLPHVRYTAVGLNFSGFIERPKPEVVLIERFLQPGPWNSQDRPLQALGLRLVYPLPHGRLSLSCDAGTARHSRDAIERIGVILSANYHLPLPEGDALQKTAEAITSFPEFAIHFVDTAKALFELED